MRLLSKAVPLVLLAVAVAGVLYLKQGDTAEGKTSAPPEDRALPRLVDLGADKCIPCKAMAPVLEELRREYAGSLEVVFIDVWKNPESAQAYEFNLIPTQLFFNADGKEIFRHEGFFAKEDILAKWKELGVNLNGVGSGR